MAFNVILLLILSFLFFFSIQQPHVKQLWRKHLLPHFRVVLLSNFSIVHLLLLVLGSIRAYHHSPSVQIVCILNDLTKKNGWWSQIFHFHFNIFLNIFFITLFLVLSYHRLRLRRYILEAKTYSHESKHNRWLFFLFLFLNYVCFFCLRASSFE